MRQIRRRVFHRKLSNAGFLWNILWRYVGERERLEMNIEGKALMTLDEIQAALADDAPDSPPPDLLKYIENLEEPMASSLIEAFNLRFGIGDCDHSSV